MALTHALSINNYGVAHLIVATSAANGSHTTLASAMADAVSGDTIFLRDSVTENVTLTAGVNITAWTGGTLNTPTITGTLTMTTAGTCNISGIRLQTNSAALLAVTGSAASNINIVDCYLNCTNNTGITFSSSGGPTINIEECAGDIGTTGIGLFTHTSTGTLSFRNCRFSNSGGSSTASTCSAGVVNFNKTNMTTPVTLSSTAATTTAYCNFDTSAQNATSMTLGGSGAQFIRYCTFISGSASSVSIGGTALMEFCQIGSSNTNAITGAGTLTGNTIVYSGNSSGVNVTTLTAQNFGITGTWTPNLQINGSSTGITYTTQTGTYTQIGNVVFYSIRMVLSSKGVSTGTVSISNFPVAGGTTAIESGSALCDFTGYTNALYPSLALRGPANGTTAGNFSKSGSAQAAANLVDTDIGNTFTYRLSGLYLVV